MTNLAILLGKSMIMRPTNLSLELFLINLKIHTMTAKRMGQKRCQLLRFEEAWGDLCMALNDV